PSLQHTDKETLNWMRDFEARFNKICSDFWTHMTSSTKISISYTQDRCGQQRPATASQPQPHTPRGKATRPTGNPNTK
ncbi:Hypothetical predicted protein, partial [Pelobates cultripes]